jgi:hypothetical protein
VPPVSVRCTRENHSELLSFGFLENALRYNSPDCPVCQRRQRLARQWSTAKVNSEQCGLRAQSQSRRQKAHRTVNRTCPVHHWTVRWPSYQKLQRLNPNGWVTWLAHRTVRPSTAAIPNGHFGGWGYKYPPTTTFQGIHVFSHCIQYKSSRLHSKTQTRDQILSQVQSSLQSNSD